MLDSYLCFSERCMLLMLLVDWMVICMSCWWPVTSLTRSLTTWMYQVGLKVSHVKLMAPSRCINFHSLHPVYNMRSLERHVIQCEHFVHHRPAISINFQNFCCHGGCYFHLYVLGNIMFLSMLNVESWILFLVQTCKSLMVAFKNTRIDLFYIIYNLIYFSDGVLPRLCIAICTRLFKEMFNSIQLLKLSQLWTKMYLCLQWI